MKSDGECYQTVRFLAARSRSINLIQSDHLIAIVDGFVLGSSTCFEPNLQPHQDDGGDWVITEYMWRVYIFL